MKMIPLEQFIEMLMEAYDRGMDFVDIVGQPDIRQDYIGIEFNDQYFGEFPREESFLVPYKEDIPDSDRKLTKDDLDKLQNA